MGLRAQTACRASRYALLTAIFLSGAGAAKGADTPPRMDRIYLRSGKHLSGSIVDSKPLERVRLKLPTGEVQTVAWGDIDRIEPQAERGRGLPTGPVIEVRVASPKEVTLESRGEGAEGWKVVCNSPCDREVSLLERYRVVGSDMKASPDFPLPRGGRDQRVRIDVRPDSTSMLALGVAGTAITGAGSAAGVVMALLGLAFDASGKGNDLLVAGVITAGVSLAGLAGSIILVSNAGTTRVRPILEPRSEPPRRAELLPPSGHAFLLPLVNNRF